MSERDAHDVEKGGDRAFLYGTPGAEVMYFDPASVYESEIEPWLGDDVMGENRTIEKWTVHDPTYHLPAADAIAEWMAEWASEQEVDEHAAEEFWDTRKQPDVLAAAEALRTAMGAHVRYRMAARHVGDHVITFDKDGDPLLDGEPLYVPAPDVRQGALRLLGLAS